MLELKSFISQNIRKYKNFFCFLSLGLKSLLGSFFAKRSTVDVWQCSEYAMGSQYTFPEI